MPPLPHFLSTVHLPPSRDHRRLHYAVQAYRELLLYVQEMCQSGSEAMRENAKVMQGNIFYQPEYRDVFVTLLRLERNQGTGYEWLAWFPGIGNQRLRTRRG